MGRKLGAHPNFVVISETVAEIWPFSIFSRWRPGFGNIKILKDRWAKGVKLHQIANFRGDWSNRGGDMAIFRLFEMVATAIVDFKIVAILMVDRVKRLKLRLRNCAKFHGNWSNRC